MLGSTQQQNVLGERTYEGVCELRFHEGGGGGEKRRQENSSPWKKNIVKVILKQRAACSLTTPRATHILHTYTWREPYTIFIQNKLKAQFDTLLCIRIVKDENSNLAK